MTLKIHRINRAEIYDDTRKILEEAASGLRFLVTRYRRPDLAILPALDLRILRELSRVSAETLTESFSHAEQSERVALVRIIAWLEELDEED